MGWGHRHRSLVYFPRRTKDLSETDAANLKQASVAINAAVHKLMTVRQHRATLQHSFCQKKCAEPAALQTKVEALTAAKFWALLVKQDLDAQYISDRLDTFEMAGR